MEYIRVLFDSTDIRFVLANGDILGKTERKLILQAGNYEIALSGAGYHPEKWTGPISSTSSKSPLEIEFTRIPSLPPTRVKRKAGKRRTGRRQSGTI